VSKVRTLADLNFVVEDFRSHALKMRWDDPEVALGNCDTAARSFTSFASNARVKTRTYSLPQDLGTLANLFGLDEEALGRSIAVLGPEDPESNFHQVSIVFLDDVTEVTVDWTARQFDPTLPFPLISIKEP